MATGYNLAHLPVEAHVTILAHCEPLALASHATVCKAFATVVRGDVLWMTISANKWTTVPTDIDMKKNLLLPVRPRTADDGQGTPFRLFWREYYWMRLSFSKVLALVRQMPGLEEPSEKKKPSLRRKKKLAPPVVLPTSSEIGGGAQDILQLAYQNLNKAVVSEMLDTLPPETVDTFVLVVLDFAILLTHNMTTTGNEIHITLGAKFAGIVLDTVPTVFTTEDRLSKANLQRYVRKFGRILGNLVSGWSALPFDVATTTAAHFLDAIIGTVQGCGPVAAVQALQKHSFTTFLVSCLRLMKLTLQDEWQTRDTVEPDVYFSPEDLASAVRKGKAPREAEANDNDDEDEQESAFDNMESVVDQFCEIFAGKPVAVIQALWNSLSTAISVVWNEKNLAWQGKYVCSTVWAVTFKTLRPVLVLDFSQSIFNTYLMPSLKDLHPAIRMGGIVGTALFAGELKKPFYESMYQPSLEWIIGSLETEQNKFVRVSTMQLLGDVLDDTARSKQAKPETLAALRKLVLGLTAKATAAGELSALAGPLFFMSSIMDLSADLPMVMDKYYKLLEENKDPRIVSKIFLLISSLVENGPVEVTHPYVTRPTLLKVTQALGYDQEDIVAGWIRILTKFPQLMSSIMQPLFEGIINKINQTPDFRVLQEGEEIPENYQSVEVGQQRVVFNQQIMDDQKTALQSVLWIYDNHRAAIPVGVTFAVAQAVLPLMNFMFDKGTKERAWMACTMLGEAIAEQVPSKLEAYCSVYFQNAERVIMEDRSDPDVCDNLNNFIMMAFKNKVAVPVQRLVELMFEEQASLMQNFAENAEDEDVQMEDVEASSNAFYSLEVTTTCLKHMAANNIPVETAPMVLYLTQFFTSASLNARQWATLMVDDLLEFIPSLIPSVVQPLGDVYTPILRQKLQNVPDFLQAVGYGAGWFVQRMVEHKAMDAQQVSEIGLLLVNIISEIEAMPLIDRSEYLNAYDNLISAALRALTYAGSLLNDKTYLATFYFLASRIPIENNETERPPMFLLLSTLLGQGVIQKDADNMKAAIKGIMERSQGFLAEEILESSMIEAPQGPDLTAIQEFFKVAKPLV